MTVFEIFAHVSSVKYLNPFKSRRNYCIDLKFVTNTCSANIENMLKSQLSCIHIKDFRFWSHDRANPLYAWQHGEDSDYAAAIYALNAHFTPKVNSTYARHTSRQLQQNAGETVVQFASRLKRYANDCEYGTDMDNQILDEILHKCQSGYLRRKLLEEGPGLTLTRTLALAQQFEMQSRSSNGIVISSLHCTK